MGDNNTTDYFGEACDQSTIELKDVPTGKCIHWKIGPSDVAAPETLIYTSKVIDYNLDLVPQNFFNNKKECDIWHHYMVNDSEVSWYLGLGLGFGLGLVTFIYTK